MRRMIVAGVLLAVIGLTVGCGTVRETLPGRSATEQFLISTAADRAVDGLQLTPCEGKAVFIDPANLDAFDKPYVLQRMRDGVLANGGRVVGKAEEAEVVLQIASGALSVNRRDYMVGLPSVPMPIPNVGTVQSPELALFKIVLSKGRAKLLVSAVDPKTGGRLWPVPTGYGLARTNFWWLLLTGPYKWTDVPE